MNKPAAEALASGENVRSSAFPKLLMKLLNDEVAPDALWWLPDGTAFVIDPNKISSQILNPYFRGTKFSSFIRRLHNTGFRRRTRYYRKMAGHKLPEGAVVLGHSCFLRTKLELLERFNEESAYNPEKANATAARSALEEAKSNYQCHQDHQNNASPFFGGSGSYQIGRTGQIEEAATGESASVLADGSNISALLEGRLVQPSMTGGALSTMESHSSMLARQEQARLLQARQAQLRLLSGAPFPASDYQASQNHLRDLLLSCQQQQQQQLLRQQQQQQQQSGEHTNVDLRQRLLLESLADQQRLRQHLQLQQHLQQDYVSSSAVAGAASDASTSTSTSSIINRVRLIAAATAQLRPEASDGRQI